MLTGIPATWTPVELGKHQVRLQVSNSRGLAFAGPFPVTVVASTFSDVPPGTPSWGAVETLSAHGVAVSCGDAPPRFCPQDPVTRAVAAVQISRALHPSQDLPAPVERFADVPRDFWAASQIEDLHRLGFIESCTQAPLRFCPEEPFTRAQTAVFVLRARYGAGYVPPHASGSVFADVPSSHGAAAWIEQLARDGISAGCATSPLRFCPDRPATREEVAVFLARALTLSPRPAPLTFRAMLCAAACTFPSGLPLEFALSVRGGRPESFEYDWAGDGTFEETSATPILFHTYRASSTYRPQVRLRSGAWTSSLAHPPIVIRSPVYSLAPPAPSALAASHRGTVPPRLDDPPGTLWRTAFTLRASAARQAGFVAYLSAGGSPFRPAAILPADLSRSLLLPYLPRGATASVYLVPFNESAVGRSSPIRTLTSP